MKTSKDRFVVMFMLLVSVSVVLVLYSRHAEAQGPANGLAVHVINDPSVKTSTVPIGTVDARIIQSPFFQSSVPVCDTPKRCFVTFPVVPPNKRLRVTRIHGMFVNSNVSAFFALDVDQVSRPFFVHPLAPFTTANFGQMLSFNEQTDVIYEAGQTPILEMGTSGTFFANGNNRLGITGDFLDVVP